MRQPVNGEYQSQVTLKGRVVYPISFPNVAISVEWLLS
jgi:hypothetical protein